MTFCSVAPLIIPPTLTLYTSLVSHSTLYTMHNIYHRCNYFMSFNKDKLLKYVANAASGFQQNLPRLSGTLILSLITPRSCYYRRVPIVATLVTFGISSLWGRYFRGVATFGEQKSFTNKAGENYIEFLISIWRNVPVVKDEWWHKEVVVNESALSWTIFDTARTYYCTLKFWLLIDKLKVYN